MRRSENDLANRHLPLPSLTITRGGSIAAVCSRCRSQHNFTNSPWTRGAMTLEPHKQPEGDEHSRGNGNER
jgi:hypothetical protein